MSKKDKSAEILKRCRRIYDNPDVITAEPNDVFPSIVEEAHASQAERDRQNDQWAHVPDAKKSDALSKPSGYERGTTMPPDKDNAPARLESFSGYDKSNLDNVERMRKDDGLRIKKD